MENTFWDVIGAVISLGLGTAVSLFFVLRPEWIIRLQAKFYQVIYRDMTDEQIDSRFQLPWDKALIGPRSAFIRSGVDKPKQFTRLVLSIRIFGFFILLLFACSAILFAIFVDLA